MKKLNENEQEVITGGIGDDSFPCPNNPHPSKAHVYVYVNVKRDGFLFGDLWPDYLHKCIYCGNDAWFWSISTNI